MARVDGAVCSRHAKIVMVRVRVRVFGLERAGNEAAGQAGVRTQAGATSGSGFSQKMEAKAKGKSDNFSNFDGLVQQRIGLTLRCAPVDSILWWLGGVIKSKH